MTETKTFHIGDILTIMTGRLVSPRHMAGVHELCDWMSGEQVYTHQLPRVAEEIEPQLRADFPFLAAVEVPEGLNTEERVLAWLASLYPTFGETREVSRLRNPEDHTQIDPIAELKLRNPDAQVIKVDLRDVEEG